MRLRKRFLVGVDMVGLGMQEVFYALAVDGQISLPIEWMLGTVGTLGASIATMAVVVYKVLMAWRESERELMNEQKQTLDARIAKQDGVIERLQADIERVSGGCGMGGCLWGSNRGGKRE